jgi:hypothetical protein
MRTEAAAALLRRTRLLAGLREETLRALAERSVERSFARQSRLFHQGDPGSGLFVVASGLVKVVVTSEDGEQMVLVTVGPGEALGELSVVDGGPRSASAEALEPTVALAATSRSGGGGSSSTAWTCCAGGPASTRCRAADRDVDRRRQPGADALSPTPADVDTRHDPL